MESPGARRQFGGQRVLRTGGGAGDRSRVVRNLVDPGRELGTRAIACSEL